MRLRKATLNDSRFVLRLRNLPEVRKVCIKNKNRISYKEHKSWFEEHFEEYSIIGLGINDIGYLRVDKDKGISICIDRKYRNKGIGREILSKIRGHALIDKDNKQSIKCFSKAGFTLKAYRLER